MEPLESIIGHIDMDAFFASVEERNKPYLKGSIVIIGSDPRGGVGRGVVSTANYLARELGICSAMPISKAWKLCEELRKSGGERCIFITPSTSRYGKASKEVFDIVKSIVPVISQTSVDEASLDLSFCNTFKKAEKLAKKIKTKIKVETGLTCSIGIGPNRMIAKIASDYEKPNGLTVVLKERVKDFLEPLPIRKIPGVGRVMSHNLFNMNIRTVADAQKYSWEELQNKFGKHGFSLWEKVNGIDERKVEKEKTKSKSIGKHYTFDSDTNDIKKVTKVINKQVKTILEQVKNQNFVSFRTVVLTIRFENFVTKIRSITFNYDISSENELRLKTIKLLLPFFEKKENPTGLAIRLVGIRVEKLK